MSVGSDWDLSLISEHLNHISKSLNKLVELEEKKVEMYKGTKEQLNKEDKQQEEILTTIESINEKLVDMEYSTMVLRKIAQGLQVD